MNMRKLVIGSAFLAVLTVSGYFFKGAHPFKQTAEASAVVFSLDNLKTKKNVVDIVVIGSGPAGWSAALYGARMGYRTLVITGFEPGGQLTKTSYVENWPGATKVLGPKVMESLELQARAFGADVILDTVVAVDMKTWPYQITTEEGRKIYAQTIIIATGASPKKLSIPGEQEYWGKGVTTCAICDAPFYRGKNVVVVGGGDSATEEALQLSAHAKKITMLVRKDTLRASDIMQKRVAAVPSISVHYNVEIQKIMGDGQSVKAIELKNNETGEISVMPIDGVFLAIGHTPNTSIFTGKVDMTELGYIKLHGRTQETSVPSVFGAGDVEDDRYRQAAVAAGSGVKAALDAGTFLTDLGFNKQLGKELERRGVYFEDVSREKIELPHLVTIEDFDREVKQQQGLAVVDFYADYCPSCMQMLPVVESMASKFKGMARFYKVDAAQAKELVFHLHVPKVPCLLFFKDGALVARYNTTLTRTEFSDLLRNMSEQPQGDR